MTATPAPRIASIFDQAARVFDGWVDPDTSLRVLRVHLHGAPPERENWGTIYHQFRCFLDGGRKVLLDCQPPKPEALRSVVLDLTTGQAENPFPLGCRAREVADATQMAVLMSGKGAAARAILWDMRAQRELASVDSDGFQLNWITLLSDDRRALVVRYKGRFYNEHVYTRHDLLTPGEPPRQVFESDGYFSNHIQTCPTDPELYAYDRWPSPVVNVPQVIHLRTLDGRRDEPLKMDDKTVPSGDTLAARDHYVWTPDARRIVSYFRPEPLFPLPKDFNHFAWDWWLSVTDVQTGEDFSASYPPGRFGGHMQASPDSRFAVCAGGPGYDKLFLVDLDGMRHGWNERVLCSYPKTVSQGNNKDPFPFPFVLPDQSGVIFNAGWPGPEHGVHLCEWPGNLR